MIVLRNKIFSKKKEKEDLNVVKDGKIEKSGIIAGSALLGAGISDKLWEKSGDNFLKSEVGSDIVERYSDSEGKSGRLKEGLKKKVRDLGVELVEDELEDPNYSHSTKVGKFIGKNLKKFIDKNNIPLDDKVRENLDFMSEGKSRVTIKPTDNSASLAHELGHAVRDKSKKVLTRAGVFGSSIGSKMISQSPYISAVTGFASGLNDGDEEKKDFLIDNYHIISPLAGNAMVLNDEARASREGYKKLKKLKASPELLKAAKKQYKHALGTYLYHGLKAAGISTAIGEGGKVLGRLTAKLGKEEDKNKKKD